MRLNDPDLVRRQYQTEAGLAVRRDWHQVLRGGVRRPFRCRTVNAVFVAETAA